MKKYFIFILLFIVAIVFLFKFMTWNSLKRILKNLNGSKVTINKPVSLSYKTKKYVYDLRKEYVNNSIFRDNNYEPSDAVFG